MKTAIEQLGKNRVKARVQELAARFQIPAHLGIGIVCAACCNNIDLAPSKRSKNISTNEKAITHWVEKFFAGYKGRPSGKIGAAPRTVPDSAVSDIIRGAIPHLDNAQLKDIEFAHRLSMSAENLLGPFVEEYVFDRLRHYGWALAWGETVRSVDLCSSNGRLIQIKNRSNTENSSSNKIREGTNIQKWFRVDAMTGRYFWEDLCALVGCPSGYLSEEDFRAYIKSALGANPLAVGIDTDSPWNAGR